MNDSLKINFTDQLQKVPYSPTRPSLKIAIRNAKVSKISNAMMSALKSLSEPLQLSILR